MLIEQTRFGKGIGNRGIMTLPAPAADIPSDYTVKSQAISALIISRAFSTLRNIN